MFRRTMASILKQSLTEFELIVIDDASTDNSSDIIAEYAKQDSRIRTHDMAQNSGQGASRDVGTKLAKGQYIFYIDQDDFLYEDAFANWQEVARQNNFPDLIEIGCRLVKGKDELFRSLARSRYGKPANFLRPDYRLSQPKIIENYLLNPLFPPWHRVLKKDLAQRVQFPHYLPEDILHSLRVNVSAQSKLVCRRISYIHYQHQDSCYNSTENMQWFRYLLKGFAEIDCVCAELMNLAIPQRHIRHFKLFYLLAALQLISPEQLRQKSHREDFREERLAWVKLFSAQVFGVKDYALFLAYWCRNLSRLRYFLGGLRKAFTLLRQAKNDI